MCGIRMGTCFGLAKGSGKSKTKNRPLPTRPGSAIEGWAGNFGAPWESKSRCVAPQPRPLRAGLTCGAPPVLREGHGDARLRRRGEEDVRFTSRPVVYMRPEWSRLLRSLLVIGTVVIVVIVVVDRAQEMGEDPLGHVAALPSS